MESYSVLMSVYHREKAEYFRESILSMLQQTAATDDFVIVCDGALTRELDNVIEEMTEQYPDLFQIVRLKEQKGLGSALREGISFCKNELIVRMDSDDISVPDRCRMQLEAFQEKDLDLAGGNVIEFESDISIAGAERQTPETGEEILQFARRRNPFNHPTVMFRKASVLKAGSYEDCLGFEDYYLWARMLGCGMKGYNIQKTLVYMRIGEGMYKRRGGLGYAANGVRARWKIHKTGISGFLDFLISAGGQVAVSLIPPGLRKCFYGRFLRRKGAN